MAAASPSRFLTLGELAGELTRVSPRISGDASVELCDVRQDSRRVEPGDLFVARGGGRHSGVEFLLDAKARGAVALMLEHAAVAPAIGLPMIEVSDVRLGLALAAEAVQGHPSRRLAVVGITGTNGKTTCSFLIQAAIAAAGGRAARLGTLGYDFEADHDDSGMTTPEADEVSRSTARAERSGATHLVMEVSSHALSLARVEATQFRVAVFTNLSQDHLDFHRDMAEYAAAKRRLFSELEPRAAVINVDDAFGAELARDSAGPRLLTVSKRAGADVYPLRYESDARGIRATLRLPSGELELETRLVGEHNLENLLTTLAVVEALELSPERAAQGLASVMVPGRLERCDSPGDDLMVLVDYAHTPAALERALSAVRGLGGGALSCVFGCGGDRDPDKRPKMGAAVGKLADRAIITNDNPRSEAPEAIARAIEPGLKPSATPYAVVLDRSAAIQRAVLEAAPGDVVLIAGKGHEPYQIIGGERKSFDDRAEARRALALRRERRGG